MNLDRMNRELREVKTVPWQLVAVILAVVLGLPLALFGTWGLLDAKGQGSSILAGIFAVPAYLLLLGGIFGMWSRVRQAAAAGEPTRPIVNKLIGGSGILLGGVALAAAFSFADVPGALKGAVIGGGFVFLAIPGLWLIMKAMIPPKPVKTYAPLGMASPISAGGDASTTPATALPPRPVMPPRPRHP
ncbi:MAG: hypothetical protein ABIP55_12730 [Tepidisphaeraceae bacterium]